MKKKFDVTKHQLVPKHLKVSEKEKAELLKRYNITVKELPKILVDDSAIEHLEVKVDDVVKIIRQSPTAGEVLFYRCVTNG
ncbi:DNA-directed RNA polymerase subunit H [Candidatus Woesearchaeota archaeon]|nr:DNA-directed RNA polymerase subunit H [Candidatus Woesearchaeota archaeon]